MKETYYLIYERLVGKANEQVYYLFQNGYWVPDKGHVILDHLYGYDPYEPEGSPYAMYNSSVMDEMEEIERDQAVRICGRQLYDYLIKKWKDDFHEAKLEWDKKPLWPAKCVGTSYEYEGYSYGIEPTDLGLTMDPYDQGFMELIQEDIENDLKKHGADNIQSGGLLD